MMQERPNIAVVSINRAKYSETFIQDSFDAFPGLKQLLYGAYLPTHNTSDWRIEGEKIPQKARKFWQKEPKESDLEGNLAFFLQQQKINVVLAHYGPSGTAIMKVCQQLNLPLIVHFHGYDAFRSDILNAQGQDYKALFQIAAAIVVVSKAMHTQLQALGAPAEKLKLIPYGIDPEFWTAAAYPETKKQFLFVGRFVAKKAPLLVIRAFSKLHERYPKGQLAMVGDGPLLEDCKNLVADLGLEEFVEFKGAQSRTVIRGLLAESLALVLPSSRPEDGDSEGTPLVILEAGSCARPVIATAHGGIPDVIQSGDNGILVQENSVESLVDAMEEILLDSTMAAKMGEKGRQQILEKYTASAYHQALIALIRQAIQ